MTYKNHNLELSYQRKSSNSVRIGQVAIGHNHPIVVQSMVDTSTNDIEASVKQSIALIESGAQMIRYTTQGSREVNNLSVIKSIIRQHYDTPIIADVHFRSDIADEAAIVADKVRINPGNYAQDIHTFNTRFRHFLSLCKQHNVAVRIGVNHGSLSKRILEQYGNTQQAMIESCLEFLHVASQEDFSNVVLSVKSSDTRIMYETVKQLYQTLYEQNLLYPIHLGVTEAGFGEDGRIKSAVGIGACLSQGIGDTIRVSLSEDPCEEIPVAQHIISYFTLPTSNRYNQVHVTIEDGAIIYESSCSTWDHFVLEAAAETGHLLWDENCSILTLKNKNFSSKLLKRLEKDILQAAGIVRYKNEYVVCPGCGRTMFNLHQVAQEVKNATQHLSGLKIAIMGCIVNGIGEMGNADYGYVGAGANKISLYKNQKCVLTNIPQEQAVERLLEIIQNDTLK